MKKAILFLALTLVPMAMSAQQKSDKRGIGENSFTYEAEVNALAKGVTWYYNWGQTPSANVKNVVGPGTDMEFVPMIWSAKTDDSGNLTNVSSLITYLDEHPGVKYLLGFNEPNFTAQANMLPSEAAKVWPKVEEIATKYNLGLVAPALNYSGQALSDGKTYQPNDWMDAFIASYKEQYGTEPRMDYLALHSYMNSPTAMLSYVENFAKRYDKKVWLTEFCSWEGTVDSISQQKALVQRINLLETSEYVFRYAWFKAKGTATAPYYRLLINPNLKKEPAPGTLSNTGQLYVNMSGFDKNKYYVPGEMIPAKDYVGCKSIEMAVTTDDDALTQPIVVSSFDTGTYLEYQVEVADDGNYTLETRLTDRAYFKVPRIGVYVDGNSTAAVQQDMKETGMTADRDVWETQSLEFPLTAGKHTIQLRSLQSTDCKFNWFRLSLTTGINEIAVDTDKSAVAYNLLGQKIQNTQNITPNTIYIINGKKVIKK